MNLYKGNEYVLLFFVYGLAFFSMGISALQQHVSKGTSFSLLKSVKYLGYFGIIHGLTEWIIMVRITRFYPENDLLLHALATLFNAISFTFLWTFGLKLWSEDKKHYRWFKYIPWLIFIFWSIGFALIFVGVLDLSHSQIFRLIFVEDIISRYFIGIPANVITSFALYKNAQLMYRLRLKKIAMKFNLMAIFFGLYGFFAGVIVERRDFFPANIFNRITFFRLMGFPVELARATSAIMITIFFIGAIDLFRWETNQKIAILTKQQITSQERRKLGIELHDGIIQSLFATGLLVENLIDMKFDKNVQNNLQNIKFSLNDSIQKVRDFIKKVSTHSIGVEDLRIRLIELIEKYKDSSSIRIYLNYDIPDIVSGVLSREKLTQLYYIIQEAITNTIKHSEATELALTVTSDVKAVKAIIEDNGRGFDKAKAFVPPHYGIQAMKERALSVQGDFLIHSDAKGTKIQVEIPWEEDKYEEN